MKGFKRMIRNYNVCGVKVPLSVLDPNFGYEVSGANSGTNENYIQGTLFTCPDDGIGESISVYYNVGPPGGKAKCAVYDAGSNLLTNGVTDEIATVVSGLNTFNFSAPKPVFQAGTSYHLCSWAESVAGGIFIRYDTANGGTGYKRKYKSQAYDSFPASITWDAEIDNQVLSIYCTYSLIVEENSFISRPLISGIKVATPIIK